MREEEEEDRYSLTELKAGDENGFLRIPLLVVFLPV